ncbi:MAG: hypothetical protein QM817_13710 [Archangium sp.]
MRLLAVLAVVLVSGLSACGANGPAVMEFVEIVPNQPRIGDVVTVRFRLLDSRGVPLAGAPVDFKLQSANTSVTLTPPSAPSIKGSGFAETQLVASTRVNSVIVVATSGDKSIQSPPITFAGTVPNGRQLSFQCGAIAGTGSGGRHALGAFDSSRTLIIGSSLDCTAHVGDRNGDGVEKVLVSFMTEAGTIGPTDISQASLVGDATVIFKTSLPLPVDVAPDTFSWTPPQGDPNNTGDFLAPLWMEPFHWTQNPLTCVPPGCVNYTLQEPRRPDPIRLKPDGTGRFENNPRDNLVSMIAVTSGEEGFTDTNNNGQFDTGEDFDDLTEPFVDSNDNGTWDAFERFIDANGNRQWDGKNGRWDANTLIWRQERIIWTGYPALEDTLDVVPGVAGHRKIFSSASPAMLPPMTCPMGSTLCAAAGPPVLVAAYLADPWFNSIAQNGDGDQCRIEAGDMAPVKAEAQGASGFLFTYPAGQHLKFVIKDARDPLATAMTQVPRRSPPILYTVSIICNYTSSPREGYLLKLGAGSISGTIE